MDTNELQVIHNTGKNRFEINVESHTAELNYSMSGKTIIRSLAKVMN